MDIYFDGTLVQQIIPPFTTTSNYNITGLYSDGAAHTVKRNLLLFQLALEQ
ncbi:MAG: hypothetical protein IPL98_08220 [Saprospiraceae bacterium]|nr:hypothetical protein [Saprospiraceae bacterium]